MKKLLSTLLAVLLAVTMLTGMAIPAQAAENDIFNPGVLELDGSAAVTFSQTMNAAYFTFTPATKGMYEFKIQDKKLRDLMPNILIYDNYLNVVEESDDMAGDGSRTATAVAATLDAGVAYIIGVYAETYDTEDLARPITLNLNALVHKHDIKAENCKATKTVMGYSIKYCTTCALDDEKFVIYAPYKTVKLSKTSYTYDGKEKQPGVTVLDEDGKPIARGEYDLVYPKSAKNVGKYTVTIKFKNHYAGTEKRTFTINPKGTSLSKVTSPKKAQLKVTWKKQATQTTGYQVQYSTDKNFKKGNKTVTVKGAKTTAKTISKLTKGKKYYVRVRTYKTVNKTNFYSGWSKSSSVTVKK